ncbi:hypothetical protein Q1695_007044 [Nippostrongylus brasiliensis]|nr:hypothetical protein Q1695_007044 [Nippostrongylus brasiliensis]
MFVHPSQYEVPDKPTVGGDYGYVIIPASRGASFPFWIRLTLSVASDVLCLALNIFFSIVCIAGRNGIFNNSFYALVMVFSLAVVANNTYQLIYILVVGLGRVSSTAAGCASMLIELTFTYFSILLIFCMALNRYAAFSTSRLKTAFTQRKTVCRIVIVLLLLSVTASAVVCKLSGLQRGVEEETMDDYATDMIPITVTNYVFYALPLVASIFFFLAYRSVRSQRPSAISDQTKSLLDKAEKCNLKQGITVLVVYLISFILDVVMSVTKPFGLSLLLLFIAQLVCSAAPQLSLPIGVLIHSREARHAAKRTCFLALKKRLLSNISSSGARVGSASSSKSLPATLRTSSIAISSLKDDQTKGV